MIGYLRGRLIQKAPPVLVLDVNGVGYEIEAPMTTFYALPEEQQDIALFTHLVVREDAQLLFGFSDLMQRDLFRSLLKVNGVGPRVALAILSTLSAAEFVSCVRNEDALSLTRVPGIGKKTAERMIIDMRDRIGELGEMSGTDSGPIAAPEDPVQDAIGALMALGYKPADASRAVRAVQADGEAREDIIRLALQHLSKR